MSSLFHLVYTSRALARFDAEGLDSLAQQASACNQRSGITGLLLYGNRQFLQLLEGERETVEQLYFEKIKNDPRHTDCTVLLKDSSALRLLPDWSMGQLFLQQDKVSLEQSWEGLCFEIMNQNPEAVFARAPAVTCINTFINCFAKAQGPSVPSWRDPSNRSDAAVQRIL